MAESIVKNANKIASAKMAEAEKLRQARLNLDYSEELAIGPDSFQILKKLSKEDFVLPDQPRLQPYEIRMDYSDEICLLYTTDTVFSSKGRAFLYLQEPRKIPVKMYDGFDKHINAYIELGARMAAEHEHHLSIKIECSRLKDEADELQEEADKVQKDAEELSTALIDCAPGFSSVLQLPSVSLSSGLKKLGFNYSIRNEKLIPAIELSKAEDWYEIIHLMTGKKIEQDGITGMQYTDAVKSSIGSIRREKWNIIVTSNAIKLYDGWGKLSQEGLYLEPNEKGVTVAKIELTDEFDEIDIRTNLIRLNDAHPNGIGYISRVNFDVTQLFYMIYVPNPDKGELAANDVYTKIRAECIDQIRRNEKLLEIGDISPSEKEQADRRALSLLKHRVSQMVSQH
jgi:hypothetical protein